MNDLRLVSALQDVVRYRGRRRKYGVHLVLLAFVVGALLGVRRLAHLEWLREDAVLQKWLRLPDWPVRRVFSAGLAFLDEKARQRLEELVCALGLRTLPADRKHVVLDIDGTAVVSFGKAEGSAFGYCGKGRRRRRHYPLVASLSETRGIIAVLYRGGAQVAGAELVSFFERAIRRVQGQIEGVALLVRGDSGMWTHQLLAHLTEKKVGYVFAQEMRRHIKGALLAASWEVDPDDERIEFCRVPGDQALMKKGQWLVGIRRRDDDPSEPAQGKLIKDSPRYKYQALITDQAWEPKDVWRFYNQRADCERVFRAGKQALALGNLVGHSYAANAAAFLLRCLAFNIDLLFQAAAEKRAEATNRPARRLGLEWRQFRFYNSPGRLLRTQGKWVLRVPTNPQLAEVWRFYRPLIGVHQPEVPM